MRRTVDQLPPPAWLEPADAERHWRRDLAHFPGQLSELDGELLHRFIEGGFRAAMASHGLPFTFLVRRLWTYYYQHEGALPLPDDERAAMLERFAPVRERARTTIAERRCDAWLPEIHEHLAFWAGCDPATLRRDALTAHLDTTIERAERLWVLHFELMVAMVTAKRALLES